ncbi:MAG TPA: hypothetical protein PLR65_03340, partial [Anaerolineales bacterium]|nr:hypothetical protein [Anaerolineales bacterium]
LTGNLFFKHKGHDGHKGKRKESRLFFAFVYFVPFVVKLFAVNDGRPIKSKESIVEPVDSFDSIRFRDDKHWTRIPRAQWMKIKSLHFRRET